MKKKLVAIAFSDLHLSNWAKFNDNNKRTLNHFKVLSVIAKECVTNGVPALFCGDLFHKPESLDPDLGLMFRDTLIKFGKTYKDFKCFAIEGNHDIKYVNTLDVGDKEHNGLHRGWVSLFETDNLVVLSPKTPPAFITKNIQVHGVPYIDHNIGLNQYLSTIRLSENFKHILLLHTDYPGAQDCDGRIVDSVENLNVNIINRFDLVLCGHIHKPQRLSKKVFMVGAPLQQRRSDKNCKLGYWKIYSDLSMEFEELKGFPKFIDVETSEEIKEDGNYYTVIPKKTSEPVVIKHKITKRLSKKSLAKKYLKEKGISDNNKMDLLISILKKSEESC